MGKGKGKVWGLVLGSSVIAGVIGACATYYFDNRKIEAQNTQLREMEKREVYTSLGKDIQKFDSDLSSAVITFNYADNHPKEKGFAKNVAQSIHVVTEQMKVITQALGNALIEESTRKTIKDVLDELGHKLALAQNDRRTISSLVDHYNQSLKQRIINIKTHIEDVKSKLHIVK